MAEPLLRALNRMRALILDDTVLVRALATGRQQKGGQKATPPKWRRVEMRYVDLKAGRHLQITAYDDTQAHTSNHSISGAAHREALDDLLDMPFGNWQIETTTETHQVQATKKLEAIVNTRPRGEEVVEPDRGHDKPKQRLLPEDAPVLIALGISDAQGKVKPSRQAKYRQVEEFLRALSAALDEAMGAGKLRRPTAEDPLRIVDLGCGNAYLTFAAHAYLRGVRELDVRLTGVDVKVQSFEHNTALATQLGVADELDFVVGSITGAELPQPPDVVLALHACDTATDDALARAVEWETALVLAAPCCHHDISAQMRRSPTPKTYSLLTRDGILRERFADTLTDALRASILRLVGYRVEVMEFVESQHTPRNTLVRAIRTGNPASAQARADYDSLVETWRLRPHLAQLLVGRLEA